MKKSADDLQPGERIYLPNSRAIVIVTANKDGRTEGIRESDRMPVLLDRVRTLYDVVEVSDGAP